MQQTERSHDQGETSANVRADAGETPPVRAYPRALRWATGGLLLTSGLALPLVPLWMWLSGAPPLTPPTVLRALLALSLLPALASWLLQRALTAVVVLERGMLRIRVGGQRFDVPRGSVASVEPWRVPLPQPGVDLRLTSGERFALGLGTDDPHSLIERLVAAGAVRAASPDGLVSDAASGTTHPTVLYAAVKHRGGRLGARRMIAKFPLFGALVAGVLFDAYQQVAYGGTFGQYELDGALSYARTFAVYWLAVTIFLVLYASAWRWTAELVAWLGAHGGEKVATRTRRLVELSCRIAYYAGVPLLLASRFAQ